MLALRHSFVLSALFGAWLLLPLLPYGSSPRTGVRAQTMTPDLLDTTVQTARVFVGLRGGYGFSNIARGSDELAAIEGQFDNASSLNFGAELIYNLKDWLALRTGVGLTRKGTARQVPDDRRVYGVSVPFGAEAKVRFTYVEVPLLLQVDLRPRGRLRPFAFAGPSLGYATAGNVRVTSDFLTGFSLMTTKLDLDGLDYQRTHLAAVGGLGLRYQMRPYFQFYGEARYAHGLTDSYEVAEVPEEAYGYRTWNFGVGFGVGF